MVKVNITLSKETLQDPVRLEMVKNTILNISGMTGINEKRLQRYGILSGSLPKSKLPQLSNIKEIDSISGDEVRFAI
jgi:hypothetical protein